MDFRLKSIPKLKALPRPDDGLRALVDRAPHAEAFAERSLEKIRPASNWIYRTRRRLATAGVLMLTAWLSLHVLFGANGMVVYRQKRAEYQELEKRLQDLQMENDVYSQIGLVMLIGLTAKNAILIVEYAKDEYEKGKALADATLEGARLRLRPILMTSFAFVFGCIPLWTATGAGAVARRILGTTVIGGMVAASVIGIFFVPAIFYAIEKWSSLRKEPASGTLPAPSPSAGD